MGVACECECDCLMDVKPASGVDADGAFGAVEFISPTTLLFERERKKKSQVDALAT